MWIKKKEIEKLSNDVKQIITGQCIDLRDHKEGPFMILKNDIHTLISTQKQKVSVLENERKILEETLADISHQLKTPLTSMMIMADLLEDAPPIKQKEFISNIQTSLQKTEWLVSSLLKMAKLEAKTIKFNKKSVPVYDIVNSALIPLKIQIELRNQNIVATTYNEIVCDKRWTSEALSNLIKNASEQSPPGSVITIKSGENPICRWISVTDEGSGISKEKLAKIFKRFEASDNINGYGIGLPLALTIMKSQFGDIDVSRSTTGTGTTFTLKFYN